MAKPALCPGGPERRLSLLRRKKVAPGEDLRSVYPDIAAQWHPVKNGRLRPEDCLPGSSKRVWWRCIDGHEWKAAVYSRTGAKKCGCPVCAGKTPRQYL